MLPGHCNLVQEERGGLSTTPLRIEGLNKHSGRVNDVSESAKCCDTTYKSFAPKYMQNSQNWLREGAEGLESLPRASY